MPINPIAAVMVHVSNVDAALAWYLQAFPEAIRTTARGTDFVYLCVGDIQLELVLADEKVSSGAAGSVVYWQVANFEESLHWLQVLGANLYRGPMQIEANLSMCQVKDPWGNCIGLRGPTAPSRT
jgi:predicted enzyme related to lactoylglutathione lyase